MDPALLQSFLDKAPKWRRRILQAALFLSPLLVVRSLNDAINTPKLALLFCAVALVLGLRLAELLLGRGIDKGARAALFPAAALFLPLALSWIFTEYKFWSLLGEYARFQGLLPYALMAVLALAVAESFRGQLEGLLWPMVASAGLVGLLAVSQALDLDPIRSYTLSPLDAPVSTLGNPNFVGGFLAIILPLTGGLLLARPDKRGLLSGVAAAQVLGIIVTGSQGALAAAGVGMALFLGFTVTRWRWARRAGTVLAGFVVTVVVLSAAAPLFFDSLADTVPQSVRLRGLWWQAGAEMALDSPLFGRGPNLFGVEGVQHRPVEEALLSGFSFPDDPHSVPINMFANAGILGLAGFAALAYWCFKQRSLESPIGVALTAAAAAYLAQSLVSIDEVTLRMSFWAVIGGLAVLGSAAINAPTKKSQRKAGGTRTVPVASGAWRPWTALAAASTVSLGALALGGLFIAADRAVAEGKRLFSLGDPVEAANRFERALSLRDETEYRHQFGFAYARYIDAMGESANRYKEEMDAAFSYVPAFPDLPAIRDHALVLAGLFPGDQAALGQAADLYVAALEIDPVNQALRLEALPVLSDQERSEDVIRVLQDVEQDGSLDVTSRGHLALAYARSGETEIARDMITEVQQRDPGDPNVPIVQELLDRS